MNTKRKNHWLFQGNPKYFDLRAALAELDEITWEANQHAGDLRPGQTGVLWLSGAEGGVVAFGTIQSEVETIPMAESEHGFVIDAQRFVDEKPRVRVRIDRVLENPISRSVLLRHLVLSSLPVIRFPSQKNYLLSDEEYQATAELADNPALLTELEAAPGNIETDIGGAIEQLIPDEDRRKWIAGIVREAVIAANGTNPNGWEFTLRKNGELLRINAGGFAMLTVRRDGVHLTLPEDAADLMDPDTVHESKSEGVVWVESPWGDIESRWPSVKDRFLQSLAEQKRELHPDAVLVLPFSRGSGEARPCHLSGHSAAWVLRRTPQAVFSRRIHGPAGGYHAECPRLL